MTTGQLRSTEDLAARIRRTNIIYARLYGPLVVLVITASFFPYYSPEPDSSVTYGNLWQEVLIIGRGVGVFGLIALLFTTGLLCLAAVGRTTTAVLIAILTGAIVIACTLLQAPGYVSPPALTIFGIIDISLSFIIAAVTLVHSLHLFALDLGFQRRMA
ncbi:hypothetical protein SAMN04489752_1169 [Brevibacterium siliguriense]|uniref:Uncharacterized protein n=1 Tax=Brevibacterium siliguriense TaxID=1136497 RepID=A0A1H1Q5V9_9MICO|nr:hypothetical protein [Brevibacterium siliguriense]SDS18770.1 hypothetical protein SAMN04489752_1169 [Brevibacterium siliguriense]